MLWQWKFETYSYFLDNLVLVLPESNTNSKWLIWEHVYHMEHVIEFWKILNGWGHLFKGYITDGKIHFTSSTSSSAICSIAFTIQAKNHCKDENVNLTSSFNGQVIEF